MTHGNHDPNGRPRAGRIGRARRAAEPLVGIRFVCGGCGRYVVKVTRKPGELFQIDYGNLGGAAAALGVGWTDGPAAGDHEKRNIPCPTCRGPKGEPRALQVYESTIAQWLDALEEARPDARAIVTYRF